ncbi:MAG: heme exporter protein CcmD [Mangrovicoccus sp.]|nr:heme exporter protein CcmD [Mangrovicoccus sp.]
MMPDLGKYAFEVVSAYLVSLGLIAILVGLSWRRAKAVRARLRELEQRRKQNG